MNKKIDDKELKLIYFVVGALVLFLIYRFAFIPLQERNEELDQEISQASRQVSLMRQMGANEEVYTDQTAVMNQEMDQIFDGIAAYFRPEDKVMFARSLEYSYGIEVTAIGLESDMQVYTMNENGSNPTDQGKILCRTGITVDCAGSYDQIKACLRGIEADDEKLSVGQATFSYNEETGKLSGTVTLYMFYLLGGDKVYEPVSIDGISIGTDNIFGITSGGGARTGGDNAGTDGTDDTGADGTDNGGADEDGGADEAAE